MRKITQYSLLIKNGHGFVVFCIVVICYQFPVIVVMCLKYSVVCIAPVPAQRQKGHQGDCPDCRWRRWRQASTSPATIRAVILTTFCFCEWSYPEGYGYQLPVSNHNKVKIMCIILGMFCEVWMNAEFWRYGPCAYFANVWLIIKLNY